MEGKVRYRKGWYEGGFLLWKLRPGWFQRFIDIGNEEFRKGLDERRRSIRVKYKKGQEGVGFKKIHKKKERRL